MPKLTVSSVLVTRTEKTRIAVKHPPEWTAEQVKEAVLAGAEEIDEQMGDVENVTFRVKRVDLDDDSCDFEEWKAPDLTALSDDDDDDDSDDDSDDDDED